MNGVVCRTLTPKLGKHIKEKNQSGITKPTKKKKQITDNATLKNTKNTRETMRAGGVKSKIKN